MKIIYVLVFTLPVINSVAQLGGKTSYSLLNLTFNARGSGLGGDFISVKDQDINLGVANPSLLNEEMNQQISLSQAFHPGGINYGLITYGKSLKRERFITGHIRYVNYGKFQGTEPNGVQTTVFNPFEYIAGVGYAKQLNPRISVGGNVSFIGSHLENYSSYGASIDFSGTYTSSDEKFLITALVKNAGIQFKSYNGSRQPLPINFQAAFSYKLAHAPFRFSVLAHHLNQWDLTYNDPNLLPTIDPLSGDTIPVKRAGFVEKIVQHLTFQVEFLAGKNLHLRTGFNYYSRQSLKVENKPGIAGISFGAGLYFKKFTLDYGVTVHSKAGINHMISLSTNLSRIRI